VVELPLAPVMSIDEVTIHGEDDAAATIDPAHYYADTLARPARLVLRPDRLWPRPGRAASGIEIKVSAGYGESPDDVPHGLRSAILRFLAYWFENRGDDAEPANVPLGAELILQPFRELHL